MTGFLIRHLSESTVFCILLCVAAIYLRRGAATRHALWLIGIAKFAIPSVLLARSGGQIAHLWPASPWLTPLALGISLAMAQISRLLSIFEGLRPTTREGMLVLWGLGTVAMLSIWIARLRASSYQLQPPSVQEQRALSRARGLLPVRLPLSISSSEAATEPVLRGIWKPIVVVPRGISERLTAAEFQAVLIHELAHARRFDNLTSSFVHCLVCLFWFHPFLWLIERRLDVERERACDEEVVAAGTAPQVYAAGILKVCAFRVFETLAGISAMTGSDLQDRLELIRRSQSSPHRSCVPRLLMAGFAVLMTIIPIAGGYCKQCVFDGQGSPTLREQGTRSKQLLSPTKEPGK